MDIIKYIHHGKEVWVRKDLKGTHREHCLCFQCEKLNIGDREKNCPIANELYKNCVKFNVTTPVFECPEFIGKDRKVIEQRLRDLGHID